MTTLLTCRGETNELSWLWLWIIWSFDYLSFDTSNARSREITVRYYIALQH